MKTVYQTLAKRSRIPRGKFTDKFCFIFGKGEKSGIQSWLLVGHRNNTELVRCTEVQSNSGN